MTIVTKKLSDIVEERNSELARKYDKLQTTGEIEADYLSTGLSTLDALGMTERGILTAVAAHTGDGKSVFAMQLIEAAAKQGYSPKACFFEDPGKFISDRYTSKAIGESAFKLRKLAIEDDNI